MGICDPAILVVCDACGIEDQFNLTKLAGRGWDDRNLDSSMKRAGWTLRPDGEWFCPDCTEEAKEAEKP